MLMRSKEYQHFVAVKLENETLRTAWGLGAALLIVLLYVDWILWLTGAADRFWGALLSILPSPVAIAAVLFLISYLVGFLLMAPWCGWAGPIEDVSVVKVTIAHILASAVFAVQPVRPLGRLLLADQTFITNFASALSPLFTGAVLREMFTQRWKDRKLMRWPLLWLPVAWAGFTFFWWVFLAEAQYARQLPEPQLHFRLAITSRKVADFLISVFVAGEIYVLLLLATIIETFVAYPLVKWIAVPATPRRWALYLVACVAFLFRTYQEDAEMQSLPFYWVALYGLGLFFRGIPSDDDEYA